MPPEKHETFPAEEPSSMPDGPIAIRQLVIEVRALRSDNEKRFDRLDEIAKRFEKIESTLARLVANYDVLLHELESMKRGHVDHEQRITKLEIRANSKLKVAPKVVKRRK